MKNFKHIITGFTLLTAFALQPQLALACMPASDAWFDEKIELLNLPAGMKDVAEYGPAFNPNKEPFYLIVPDQNVAADNGALKGYRAVYKFSDRRVYEWEYSRGWMETSLVRMDDLAIWQDKDRNVYSHGRLDNVEIPEPRNFSLKGQYKDDLLDIKGRVIYTLNTDDYDPIQREQCISHLQQQNVDDQRNNVLSRVSQAAIVVIFLGLAGFALRKPKA